MKAIISLLLIFFIQSICFSQDIPLDSTEMEVDTTFQLPKHIGQYGIYLELFPQFVPGPSKQYSVHQVSLGVSFKRLLLGFSANEYKGEYQKTVVFPNDYRLNYGYGGTYIGVHAIRKEPFELDFRLNYRWGDMLWERESTNSTFVRDKFQIIEPEIQLVYVPITYIKLFVSGSYKYVQNLNLVSINPKDFEGFSYGFGVRIGFYK